MGQSNWHIAKKKEKKVKNLGGIQSLKNPTSNKFKKYIKNNFKTLGESELYEPKLSIQKLNLQ
jgi:hypothetical protein